ncbi:MAG: thioesterase [Clostridia bacterium]|nr:thioesterase [Clostridia bacterium]
MYEYISKYDIRYTDVDTFDTLKFSSILGLLQEAACKSADELGFGYDVIMPQGIGFILSNWYIELQRPIKLEEDLEIHTWPLVPKYVIFNRDFEIWSGGEKVGVGTSRWCMIDLKNYTMLNMTKFFEGYDFSGYNTSRAIDYRAWKIPAATASKPAYEKLVTFTDYDHYNHVNNTKYADFAMDCFSVDELKGKFLSRMQVTYDKQCKMGETLSFYRDDTGDGTSVIEGRVGDDVRVQFRLAFLPVPEK